MNDERFGPKWVAPKFEVKDETAIKKIIEGHMRSQSELSQFQLEVGEWGGQTFNPKRGNNSKAIVHHLIKEVAELQKSNSPEEAADCLLLLLHHAHTSGYDLLLEAKKKMEINRKRKWGKPDKNGVVEHIDLS